MCDKGEPIRVMALAGPVGDDESRGGSGGFWRQFAGDGVDVALAQDLDECLGRLGRFEYQAVVLDLTGAGRALPELARLKQGREHVPVFVLVDATDGSVGHWVVHHGAAACLDVKHYDAPAVRALIRHTVGKHHENV